MQNEQSTTEFILEKTAPVFNRQGYIGSSLSDLTKATNLTKGAIYSNFENKEDLALQAFKWNIGKYINPLLRKIDGQENALDKIRVIVDYYRTYYQKVISIGGCPILNVGIDTKHVNTKLFNESKAISKRLINGLIRLIQDGIDRGQISALIQAEQYAKLIYTQIDGAVFLAFLHEDSRFLEISLNWIEFKVIPELTP